MAIVAGGIMSIKNLKGPIGNQTLNLLVFSSAPTNCTNAYRNSLRVLHADLKLMHATSEIYVARLVSQSVSQ